MEFTHLARPVRVHATRIEEATDCRRGPYAGAPLGGMMLRLADGRNYRASFEQLARHIPVAGDYLVRQEDGYEYLNPKAVFERKYAALHTPPTAETIQQLDDAQVDYWVHMVVSDDPLNAPVPPYSTDWAHGGPLIEKWSLGITPRGPSIAPVLWRVLGSSLDGVRVYSITNASLLSAAMRCLVLCGLTDKAKLLAA